MNIIAVNSASENKAFLRVPERLHGNDPDWICPLDAEIEAVFDPSRNLYFEHGTAQRWILLDENKQAVGRIAAFVNFHTAHTYEQPTGGIGFFDCPDNQLLADNLFNTAVEWLKQQGMKAMDGPINFGENFNWWGLQTEGPRQPLFGNNFCPPYYRQLFENYGFKCYFEQYYYEMDLSSPELAGRMRPLQDRLMQTGHFSARHADLSNLDVVAADFCTVYNQAWTVHNNVMPIKTERILEIIKKLSPILDEDIIWFAYYDDEPIGVFAMLPDINQILRKINKGRLNWFDKLLFQWYKSTGTCRRIYGFVFGVVPQFHNRGVEALLIMASADHVLPKKKYDFLELAWIGDFNPRMLRLIQALGVKKIKTYATMRKLFSEEQPYRRSELIGAGANAVAKRVES